MELATRAGIHCTFLNGAVGNGPDPDSHSHLLIPFEYVKTRAKTGTLLNYQWVQLRGTALWG